MTIIDSYAFNRCNLLENVFYNGTESQWNTLLSSIEDNNDPLLNATIHYLMPEITAQPESVTADLGSTATFTVTAGGEEISYRWQYRTSGSGSWRNATAEGNETAILTVPATANRNGYQYRCKVTNANDTVYSDAATLTVRLEPEITTQPASVSVKEGGTATFTVEATGATSWQWQYRTSSSGSWANATAEGNKTATLKVPATSGRNGYQYRCKLTNANGSTWSTAATLTVKLKPKITAQPASVSVKAGGTATFTVEATGAASWQWQYRTSSSGSWASATAEGNKTATLKVPATAARNGYQYRCKVTNAAGSSWSSAATLTVLKKPVITEDPKSVTQAVSTTATFTVEATGEASYQWQYRASDTGTWSNSPATGSKTATLKVPVTAGRNGYQYRCKVTNAAGSSWSNAATLTVASLPVITSQPQSVTVGPGAIVNFSVSASGTDLSYQWQYYSSSSDKWINITNSAYTGTTSAELSVEATTARNRLQVRCRISNQAGTVYSETAKLTVKIPNR